MRKVFTLQHRNSELPVRSKDPKQFLNRRFHGGRVEEHADTENQLEGIIPKWKRLDVGLDGGSMDVPEHASGQVKVYE